MSLQAQLGKVTVLLGRNGVGKTTLLKSLMGLVPIKTGSIEFDGKPIQPRTPYERARAGIGFVPQGREIFARLTVEENLRMGLAYKRGRHADPAELFELFPVLKQMLDRRGGDLSGGQQQQLAIARALAAEPKLLILDEPTEGIQPSIIKDIGRVIRMLADRGDMAILLVEQYYDFAQELADDYLVMERGEVIAARPRQGHGGRRRAPARGDLNRARRGRGLRCGSTPAATSGGVPVRAALGGCAAGRADNAGPRPRRRAAMITVHHLNNSRSQRVLWLLEELGLPYEIEHYQRDPKTMLAPPSAARVHPLGKSPVITDGDVTVAESGAIVEYLVERYGARPAARPPPARPRPLRYRYWLHLRRRFGDAAAAAEAGLRHGWSARRCRSSSSRSRGRSPGKVLASFVTPQLERAARLHGRRTGSAATGSPATSSARPTSR